MDILNMLKNMDKETLEKGIAQAQQFLATPEGQNAAKMLSVGKMPDGGVIPDNLKDAVNVIGNNKQAQDILGELMKARG
ncbi:MAG: hypothetical protein IJ316_04215 [Clostridia bacterium]|nr:hypothetical protein [Clostridia bacterium]